MIKVLLVDDEKDLLDAVSMYLRLKENMNSETCESAEEALNLLEKNSYDLIISDYMMPETNGIELLKKIRQTGCEIPFILFTGMSREEIAISALNSGVDYYIQKGGNVKVTFTEMSHIIQKNVKESKEREQIRHLTRILSTIRNIREVTETEPNFNILLKSICQLITSEGGYKNARIVLFTKPGDIFAAEQSGFDEDFDLILEWLKKGELTGCAKKALESNEIYIAEKCSFDCKGCPFNYYHNNNGAMTKRLVRDGKTLGILSVTVPSDFIMDKDEKFLFDTLTRDIEGVIHSFKVMEIPVC